jgi:DNA-binding MarR family transcriptional regulator
MAPRHEPKVKAGDNTEDEDRRLSWLLARILAMVRSDERDLSARQLAVLLICYTGQQTVRGLAEVMHIHKPTLTRAVDVLVTAKLADVCPIHEINGPC